VIDATLRAYIDLTWLQFLFVSPLLFSLGYLLATVTYGVLSWFDLLRIALIGLFGFEAGLVLNDYTDREFDKMDEKSVKLTLYWQILCTSPIPASIVSPRGGNRSFTSICRHCHMPDSYPPRSTLGICACSDALLLCNLDILPGREPGAEISLSATHRQDRFCPVPSSRISVRGRPRPYRTHVLCHLLPVCPCASRGK